MGFAQLIKELREDTGLSQKKLGEQLGISSSGIGHLEVGDCEPNSTTLIAYAKYFEVTTDYLLGLENDYGAKITAPAAPTRNEDEQKLIEIYRGLDPETKETLWSLLKTWTPTTTMGRKNKKQL